MAKAIDSRRLEFNAGRRFARQALDQIGIPSMALLSRKEGDPVWPPGVVGSIAHNGQFAVAGVALSGRLRGLGVDLESDAPMDSDLVSRVCRPTELATAAHFSEAQVALAKLCFVAKEAYFKAVFPSIRQFFDFLDLEVQFEGATRSFSVRVVNSALEDRLPRADQVVGRIAQFGGLTFAVAYF